MLRASILAIMAFLLPGAASAGLILVDQNSGTAQVDFFEPIGQSFTAIDTNVSAGLKFVCINCSFANDDDVKYDLYAGQGTGGSLLGSTTFSLADDFSGFYMADFSAIDLVIGNVYSLVASIVGNSPYWGIKGGPIDSYAGGSIVGGPSSYVEASIRVEGTTAAVPEPTALPLLAFGLLAGAALRRRNRA